jgi:hypothetical protein
MPTLKVKSWLGWRNSPSTVGFVGLATKSSPKTQCDGDGIRVHREALSRGYATWSLSLRQREAKPRWLRVHSMDISTTYSSYPFEGMYLSLCYRGGIVHHLDSIYMIEVRHNLEPYFICFWLASQCITFESWEEERTISSFKRVGWREVVSHVRKESFLSLYRIYDVLILSPLLILSSFLLCDFSGLFW